MSETPEIEVLKASQYQNRKTSDPKKIDPDADKYKNIAALAYVFFAIPLIFNRESKFVQFHVNQGLLFQIYMLGIWILGQIPIIGAFVVMPLGFLLGLFLFLYGIITCTLSLKKRLPIIGEFDLIFK